jgi:hypothetical protein
MILDVLQGGVLYRPLFFPPQPFKKLSALTMVVNVFGYHDSPYVFREHGQHQRRHYRFQENTSLFLIAVILTTC